MRPPSNVLRVILLRSDHHLARPIRDRLHGFNAVHHQIEDHLLQLNLIRDNDGERDRVVHAQRYRGAQELRVPSRTILCRAAQFD